MQKLKNNLFKRMVEKWNISGNIAERVIKRDQICVYCGKKFKKYPYKHRESVEHIDNNEKHTNEWNVVICCWGCNSSKGKKRLSNWFESDYCAGKNINKKTVAPVIKRYIKKFPKY